MLPFIPSLPLLSSILLFLLLWTSSLHADFPTTLQGPFKPISVPLSKNFTGKAIDLPSNDSQVERTVQGFQPEQIFVSLSSNYDSVWVSWVTGDSQVVYDHPDSVASVVRYGVSESPMDYEAIGYSLVYSQLYPYHSLHNYTSGIIHHVLLTGLKPETLYQYQCGDPHIPAMSEVFFFRTMPVSNSTNYPSRVALVGDLGLTSNTSTTLAQILSNHPDLVVLVGGLSYADMYLTNGTGSDCYACSFPDTPIHQTYQPRWDDWGRFMQPLTANVPTMVIGGKHEIEPQIDDQIFVSYSYRFAFPTEESGSSSPLYYSFNAGGIHFVMLSPYTPYDRSSDQYQWLESDLYYVNRSQTPWLVVAWHPSWYTTFREQYRAAECMRVEMEDLLYKYRVDIVFNGHVHAYERSNRVYNYSLDPCGPVFITVGAGGSREEMATTYADDPGNCPDPSLTPDSDVGGYCAFNFTSGPSAGKFCWDHQPEYSAHRETSFGHGILEVRNETYALWSWHRNLEFYEYAGDIVYIVREPERCLPG